MPNIKTIRSNKLLQSVLGSSFFKGIGILFNLLLVRYSIGFIGAEKYGTWLTLLSFFTWFSAFEVGVSSSLRNRITPLFSDKKHLEIKRLIEKGYLALSCIYIPLILILVFLSYFLPISSLFTATNDNSSDIQLIFQVSLLLYFLHFITFFLNTVLLATHRAESTYLITATQNGLLLFGVILFKYLNLTPSLLLFCGWFSIAPFIVWLMSGVTFFKTSLKSIKPEWNNLKLDLRTIFKGINKNFFVMQICTLVIFSTDNIIVLNYLSGTEVAKYNVAFKYFNIIVILFNLVLVPYWASFSEAAHKKNTKWIKKNIKRLIFLWISMLVLGSIMIILSPLAYQYWIGQSLEITISLSIAMCLSFLLTTWNNIFSYFLNSISKTKVQSIVILISALINIPLSILLINYYNSTGVIIATCISLIPLSIALPLHYRFVINKMEKESEE